MQVVVYTQPGCFMCELIRVYLEAREIAYTERNIGADPEAKRAMVDEYDSGETPTLVYTSGETIEVVVGFDPERLDLLFDSAPSSDSVA
jgi:glutaredoxin